MEPNKSRFLMSDNYLGIDTGKTHVKNLFTPTYRNTETNPSYGAADYKLPGKGLNVLVDPYSKKYLGNEAKDKVTGFFSTQALILQRKLDFMNKTGKVIPQAQESQVGYNGINSVVRGANTQTPDQLKSAFDKELYDTTEALAQANSSRADYEANYTQQDKVIDSYGKYPKQWDEYFHSGYKANMATEDNARIKQQNDQAMSSAQTNGSLASLPSQLAIKREIGTGVGKTTIGLNPFGQLDAGLNI